MAITVTEENGVKTMTDGVFTVRQEYAKTVITTRYGDTNTYNTDLLETAILCVLESPGLISPAAKKFRSLHSGMHEYEVRHYMRGALVMRRFD